MSSTASSSMATTKRTPPSAWLQKQQQQTIILQCKECGSSDIVEDHAQGDAVCTNCGVVVGERLIDEDAEWRNFEGDAKEDKCRVGGPLNPFLSDTMSTVIGRATDARSRSLARTNARASTSTSDKNLIAAFEEISRMASQLELSQRIKERANQLYACKEVQSKFRGRKNDAVIPACIVLASRLEGSGSSRGIKDVAPHAKVPMTEIGRAFNQIKKLLNPPEMTTISASDFTVRFFSHLRLPQEVRNAVEAVTKKVKELDIAAGKLPQTIVATAIFLITQMTPDCKRSIEEIAGVAGVSVSTVRSCYRDVMQSRQDELVPPSFLDWLHRSSPTVPPLPPPQPN